MANTEVNIWLKLKDDATKGLDSFKGKVEGMSPAFGKMAAAGTAGLAAIGGMAYKAVGDYMEVEQANTKLYNAVVKVSKGTEDQLAAINDVIAATEKKGVVDADNLKVGAAQLSTFGLTTNMVNKLIPSLADLTVNQAGVNATSADFESSANIMAKALNGQFGVLEKSGIRFTEAQQHMIQYGTETERIAALQEGFAQNLKYTNETALADGAGKMAVLNREMGNISENLGAVLLPILVQLVEKVKPIVMAIAEWIEANPKLAMVIIGVVAGISGLLVVVGLLGMAIPAIIGGVTALGTALAFLTMNPIGLAIMAIAALIAIGVALYKNWDEVKAKALEIWNAIAAFFKAHWDTMLVIVLGPLGAIVAAVIKNWDQIKATTVAVWNGIKDFFVGLWDGIKTTFNNAINWIMDKIRPLLNAIERVENFGGSVGGKLKNIGNSIADKFRASGGPVTNNVPYVVGERGPEMFIPSVNGKILPNHALAGSGGPTTIVNIMGGYYLDQNAARKFGEELVKIAKLNNRV